MASMDFLYALAYAAEMLEPCSPATNSTMVENGSSFGTMNASGAERLMVDYSGGRQSSSGARGHRRTRKASNTANVGKRKRVQVVEPGIQVKVCLKMESVESEAEEEEEEMPVRPISILRKTKTFLRPMDIPIFPARTPPTKRVTFVDEVESFPCPMDAESRRQRVSYHKIPEYSRNRNATINSQLEEEVKTFLKPSSSRNW